MPGFYRSKGYGNSTEVSYHGRVTGNEFIRIARRLGRERGVAVQVNAERGKGSHMLLYYGARRTIVKDRRKEIGAGLLSQMIRDLGLERKDFVR